MLIRKEQIDLNGFKNIFLTKESKINSNSIIESNEKQFVTVYEKTNWDSKAEEIHNHKVTEIVDFPLSLPANGGNADTVDYKSVNDDIVSLDTLWTSKKIKEYSDNRVDNLETTTNNKISEIKVLLSEKANNSAIDNINSELANKVSNEHFSTLINLIETKADKTTVDIIKEKLTTFADKEVVSEIEELIPTLASKSEVNILNNKLANKVDAERIDLLEVIVDGKLDKAEFELLKKEVVDARKGYTSLLDKIEEIDSRLDSLTTQVSAKNNSLPLGSIVWCISDDIPIGFKVCNGEELERDKYADLFNTIGITYGEGNGNTTFNIPNLIEDSSFIRSSGINYRVGQRQLENLTDVRESYEGGFNSDKLYLVGGKYFTTETICNMEPNNITFVPVIKVEDEETYDTSIGLFNWFTNVNVPEDYLICDGREVLRSEYRDLFYKIGTKYGAGNGVDTFNIPNLTSKNKFIKSSTICGKETESILKLTDVREAYEGDSNSDKFYPVGGRYFNEEVGDSELIPDSIALVPTIKAKRLKEAKGIHIGSFIWNSTNIVPSGYVICDGRELSRFEYSEIFDIIGTTFGEGDGVSTFNLPNLVEGNKFIRSYSNNLEIGNSSTLELADIRGSYEGIYNTNKLYPLGASYFSNENVFTGIHPNNISLQPCLKVKNLESVDLIKSVNELKETTVELLTASLSETRSVNSYLVKKLNVTLVDGRGRIDIETDTENIQSVFVNVIDVTLGEEYVCDIISNAVIKNNSITIYFRSMNDKLNNSDINATITIL